MTLIHILHGKAGLNDTLNSSWFGILGLVVSPPQDHSVSYSCSCRILSFCHAGIREHLVEKSNFRLKVHSAGLFEERRLDSCLGCEVG